MTRRDNRPRSRTALVLAALAMAPFAATAQGLVSRSGDAPVTIHAKQGIEWNRDARKYVARGDAVATRNEATVRADVLTAYYRDKPRKASAAKSGDPSGDSGQDIYRVDATGNVRINANDRTAYGDKGVYNVDEAVFVLTGRNLRFLSNQGTLTARDSLEYWEAKRMAIARGAAMLDKGEQRINADILTALLSETGAGGAKTASPPGKGAKPADTGESDVRQVDAFGNVLVSLPTAIIRGDRGVYVPKTGVATICGNVRVTSGKNQLNGECAEVNLSTNIYRLTGRAQGLVIPKKKEGR